MVFKSLTPEQLRGIVELMVADLRERLIAQGMSIELTDAARDLVAKEGADPVYGARPLRRAIQTLIEDPLSEELLQGMWHRDEIIRVDEKDGALVFEHATGRDSRSAAPRAPHEPRPRLAPRALLGRVRRGRHAHLRSVP